jgi:two-component system response regulator FixJ
MKRILIVEDDNRIATALEIRLKAAGHEVLKAVNGFDGLKHAVMNLPDLVIMDIWMPIGLGFSVAQRLQDLGLDDIPIIFITASKTAGLREEAEKLGAMAFFEKPYDPVTLMAAVSKALEMPDPVIRQ